MALTEKTRLVLESKGFAALYTEHEDAWAALANDARSLMTPLIQNGQPTVDDIKQVLLPLIELQQDFRAFMQAHPKLTQRYWPSYFTDYVLHRVYNPQLSIPEEGEDE